MKKANIGLIGLAVMGANLARNIANKGYKVEVYNRTYEKTTEFLDNYGSENLAGSRHLKEFVEKLEKPRRIIIMVKAGQAVDAVIDELVPLLEKDDTIIDCGNSFYKDSKRRKIKLNELGLNFVDCGVSGGEEGALNGPSLMPGGDEYSWVMSKDIWQAIAAKDFEFGPCVTHLKGEGAGHYVKMVHNGIEYGVMQIMAEAYDILRKQYGVPAGEIAEIFAKFNEGKLNSYLFEIAGKVLRKKDEFNKEVFLIDKILDVAAQKGTGMWTAVESLERAVATPTITTAVYARVSSGEKKQRKLLAERYELKTKNNEILDNDFLKLMEDGLYLAMISVYAQGLALIKKAAQEENWELNMAEISRIWQGGCIIRAKILIEIGKAFDKKIDNLLESGMAIAAFKENSEALRKIVISGIKSGTPVGALNSALQYLDAMLEENCSANFIQGLRDYFGAHTYMRNDRDGIFHTEFN